MKKTKPYIISVAASMALCVVVLFTPMKGESLWQRPCVNGYSLFAAAFFVMNTIGNFCDKGSTISVRSVSLGIEPLVVSESEANFWSITMMIGVPVVTVLIGFVLWLRRRKR